MVDCVVYKLEDRELVLPVDLDIPQERIERIWDDIIDVLWDGEDEKPVITVKMQKAKV